MKQITILAGWVLGFFILAGAPVLYAEPELSKVADTVEENYSDPSSITAELDSPSGERAPEDLPMDDSPSVEGMALQEK